MKRYLGIVAVAALSGMFAAGAVQSLFSAYALQEELVPPTSGIFTGVQYSQKLGNAFKSLASCNKGSSAPANVESATVDGQCWIDDTTSLWIDKFYVNGGWTIRGAYNAADSTYLGVIGGGVPASIASGSTVDLGSVPQANVGITGTTTITGFGSAAPAGIVKIIRFSGALKLTNSTALTIPCGFDLTTAANDRAIVTHLGSGNWEVTQYTRDNGVPIDCSAVAKPDFTFAESIPPLHVAGIGQALSRASYPAYLSKVTRALSGTRTSGNATITTAGITLGFGAGMPVEGTGINTGCTIASVVDNTSITLNSSSCVTASGTSNFTVFLYGYGLSGSAGADVGVPDCRNRVFAGRDRADTNGTLSNRLTTSWFGKNSTIFGIADGDEKQTLSLLQLPTGITGAGTSNINFVKNVALYDNQAASSFNPTGGAAVAYDPSGAPGITWITSKSGTASVTSNNTGGLAHPIVQPTLIAECVVRVTP